MAAYLTFMYNISNPEEYAKYNPGSIPTIMQTLINHGGEVLAAGHDCVQLHGEKMDVKVFLKFPDSQAAQAWLDDPDYAEAKAIRLSSTKDINAFIIDEFTPPG